MSDTPTIALDAMGGDIGASVVVSAAVHAISKNDNLRLILVGDEDTIRQELKNNKADVSDRLLIKHASQKVEMDELPSRALRGKKDSSMRVAINLVKEGEADATVSAGNTGALMATARFVLKTLPGIDRPAICSLMPTTSGKTHMLDLGANVDTSAENLLEFAVMGSVLVNAIHNIEAPTVGLLNIGAEEIKGNERVKEAARLLSDSDLNYIGFVEGDDIYHGKANVIVCDGFIGNVALKSSEGVAKMIIHFLRSSFKHNIYSKLIGLLAMPVLYRFKKSVDPRRYNGASLLGLQGTVVKSHGGADSLAFYTAIQHAMIAIQENVPARISQHLETHLTSKA